MEWKDERMFMIALLLLALPGLNSTIAPAAEQAGKPVPSITVNAPRDLKDVQVVNDRLTAFSQKVTACVDAGRRLETCRCSYPQVLADLRKGYENLIKQHPRWKDQSLSYQSVNRDGLNISGTLALQNLRGQLESLQCE